MRIVSKFKDYYDHVGHTYGWSGPSRDDPIVYIRDRLNASERAQSRLLIGRLEVELTEKSSPFNATFSYDLQYLSHFEYDREVRIGYLVVGCTMYLVHQPKDSLEVILGAPPEEESRLKSWYHQYWKAVCKQEVIDVSDCPSIKELGRVLQAPVYMIVGHLTANRKKNIMIVEQDIRKLSSIKGFAASVPATKVWQDIEYCMTNMMRENPDITPPVQLTDKERLVQHGFDVKQSFRHRVG